MNLITDLIGYAGAIMGTFLMIPQVRKARRTRKMDDLSLGTVILYFANCLTWLVYSTLIHAWPPVVANAIGLVVSIIQWRLKRKCDLLCRRAAA